MFKGKDNYFKMLTKMRKEFAIGQNISSKH